MKHLDDDVTAEQRLLATIDGAESALADALGENEVAYLTPAQVVEIHHRWTR